MDVFNFSRQGPFGLDEATDLVRILNQVTHKYSQQVNALVEQLESLPPNDRQAANDIESQIQKLIDEWNGKIRKLGGIPKGLWLVDIDNGQGYYCWKYPETRVEYWHDYNSGYAGRIPIHDNENSASPDQLSRRTL